MQPSFSRHSPWCRSLPGDDSQQAGDDSQQTGHLAAGRNQDGADRSSAPLQISPPGLTPSTQNMSHRHWQPLRRGLPTPRTVPVPVPQSRQHPVLTGTAASCPALPTPRPVGSSQYSSAQSTRHKASTHPAQSIPADSPGARPHAHRSRSGREGAARREAKLQPGEPATEKRSPDRARATGGRGREGLSVPRRTSLSHTVNKNPRGAAKGGAPRRLPARPRPPERHLPKREAKRSLRPLSPLRVPAPRHRHAAHGSRTVRSRTGCLFDLLPRSQGTL